MVLQEEIEKGNSRLLKRNQIKGKTSHIYKNWGGKHPNQMQQNRKKIIFKYPFSLQIYTIIVFYI